MKKYLFWSAVSIITFCLGLTAFALYYFSEIPQVAAPELVRAQENSDCIKSKSFPGFSRQISEFKKGKSGYFPKDNFSGSWAKKDDFINDWYGKHLKAMHEKSLLDVAGENIEVYRFLWLRTFHHPIFVRIERRQSEVKLFTKELDGAGGYEPGRILRIDERTLTEAEWCEFLRLLDKADYWKMPTQNEVLGCDGAEWILEGLKENRYHAVDRWTPQTGEFRAVCIYLLKLSGVDVDKLKDDLY